MLMLQVFFKVPIQHGRKRVVLERQVAVVPRVQLHLDLLLIGVLGQLVLFIVGLDDCHVVPFILVQDRQLLAFRVATHPDVAACAEFTD